MSAFPELDARGSGAALGSSDAARALELADREQAARASIGAELLRTVGQRPATAAAELSTLDRRMSVV